MQKVYEFVKATCTVCGKVFEAPKGWPNLYCRDCFGRVKMLGQFQTQLLREGFSLEQGDEKIARQIYDLLSKETQGGLSADEKKMVTTLINRLVDDEERRRKIIDKIKNFQKEKR